MTAAEIRIVLVDDHQILLDSLKTVIDSHADFTVVGTANTAQEGFQTVLQTQPDVAILDVELPGRGAFDIATEINKRSSATRIIFLTAYHSDVFVERALRLEAHGYLLKGEPVEKLLQAIRRAAEGEISFSEDVEARLEFDPERNRYTTKSGSKLARLTSRQLSILRHLARGQSVKEVAKELHLSEKSVDSHKYRIMHALDIHDRVDLSRFAIREGLTIP